MTRKTLIIPILLVGAVIAFTASYAVATPTYTFCPLSNNDPGDVQIGREQLFVQLLQPDNGPFEDWALFRFHNLGPEPSVITAVYFDDDADLLTGSINFDSDPGDVINFVSPPTPGNVPAGNEAVPPFLATVGASADSPGPQNGVGPDEYLDVLLQLQADNSFNDVADAIADGDFRIAIHVTAYESRGSESFINCPPNVIPAPGALLLATTGATLVGYLRRRNTI